MIATFSITHMAPASALICPLDQQWQHLWSSKDALAIRTIQDKHHCCGLHSVVDRPWPFPNKNRPVTACRDTLGRERSCLGYWRRDQQVSAGLLLFVAVMCFVVKVCYRPYVCNARVQGSETCSYRSLSFPTFAAAQLGLDVMCSSDRVAIARIAGGQ